MFLGSALGIADIVSAHPLWAAQYYFSALGNDQIGNGTQSSPWRSISKFNDLDLNPGDRAFFRAGDVFHGSMSLDANDTGTDLTGALVEPITIGSYGGAPGSRAVISSAPNSEALLATDSGGIELRDLEFTNGGTYLSNSGSGIQFRVDQTVSAGLTHVQHIYLDNVVSRGFHRSGVSFDATGDVGYQGVQVTNSEFFDNQFAGVEIGASNWQDLVHRDIQVSHVTVRDNPGFAGCNPHCGHGIVVGQVDGALIESSTAFSNGLVAGKGNVGIWAWQSNNVTIEKNTAYGNRSPLGGDGGGFDIDGGVTNSIVQYNVSQDNAGAGYLLAEFAFAEPMQQNVFRFNLSVNDGSDSYGAITISGENSSSKAASAVLHNNTVVVDRNVTPGSRGAVWFINGQHHDIDLVNNVFVALNGAPLIDGSTTVAQANFINNDYWTAGAPIVIGGTVFASIAQWAAATGQEMFNGQFVGLQGDPYFGPGGSYQPLPSSALIDAGLPFNGGPWPAWLAGLGPIDRLGTTLPQGARIDIGAVEYPSLTGDYNSDGYVDAADYVVWRRTQGSVGANLKADGDRNGIVDAGDYDLWRMHYGLAVGKGSMLRAEFGESIPEPTSVLLVVVAFSVLAAAGRSRIFSSAD